MFDRVIPLLWLIGSSLPVVALDAGHGGEQSGAIGPCGLVEKQLTLAITKDIAQLLRQHGLCEPLLLRETDQPLSLQERITKANQAKAALLVSIHGNASPRPERHGLEIYYLGLTQGKSADDWQLLRRENEEEDLLLITSMIPNHLLLQLAKTIRQQQSQSLAQLLHEELRLRRGPHGRGVLPGPFFLLAHGAMPAALVEVGFLTHPAECRQLGQQEVQQGIAEAIATAIVAYLQQQAEILEPTVKQLALP